MNIFEKIEKEKYERITFSFDKASGLSSVIAIHNTLLGPAYGGIRMKNYGTIENALEDVLKLSKAMTYKCAATGEKAGGGKAVILGDSKRKTEEYLKVFANFVNELGGLFITGTDMNITSEDCKIMGKESKYIMQCKDTGKFTSLGIYVGLKACSEFVWGEDNLGGKRILVQGLGNVGEPLLEYLGIEKANVIISDIDEEKSMRLGLHYGFQSVDPTLVYDTECDIFCPCAMGGILNSFTIPRLKCKIVAGAANNQFEDEESHSQMLMGKGILHAPDYIINAGGVIQIIDEYNKCEDETKSKTLKIYGRLFHILSLAKEKGIAPIKAADQYVERILNF